VKLEPFALERLQSTFEHHVDFNLSESGVQPLTLGELIEDAASREALMAEALRYTQTNGTQPLRESIAALYPGATADHVLVTNGGAEANYITTWNLAQAGDEVVMMVPNFMQTWGVARAFGANLTAWPLIAPDADGSDRGALSGGDRRSRAGHQRRSRGQLHHNLEAGRAGRRDRDDGAELHADLGIGARVRREPDGLAAPRPGDERVE